ncbi:DUF3617 domain-containing protein [Sphingomonas bacterium]|uniref:DUF3617 domain-containing protein n=1 Tax=Sphingomonas bacterium TaxID=1895847 RepID=UPI0020C5C3C0|nr:DUF3617 domain-containing protein [Sphingomonas bacterium]
MKRALIVPLAVLAACQHKNSVTADNASTGEVAAKVAAAGGGPIALAPGHYDMTYAVTKVDMPGMPPAVAQSIKGSLGKGMTAPICVTEADAKKPAASIFAGANSKACTYDHFAMATGSIDATMTCQAGPATATSTIKGSFTGDGFHMDVGTITKGPAGQPMGAMTMAATIDAHRTGACTGSERHGA